jgi:hypothetical protein
MDSNNNAESQTRSVRAEQKRLAKSQNHPRGQARTGAASSADGDISRRVARATRSGASIVKPVTGGILTQLIEQVEDQLGNDEACIEWYQREKDKHQRQLENLKQLQALFLQEEEPEQS